MESKLEIIALRLTALEQLASNCPRCFGPMSNYDRNEESDYIVCIDGNFQHRRHEAASTEDPPDPRDIPSTFLSDYWVSKWAEITGRNTVNSAQVLYILLYIFATRLATISYLTSFFSKDRCSTQHRAANDTRGQSTWRGCEATGVIGLACRHDHLLKLVNLVRSGEK